DFFRLGGANGLPGVVGHQQHAGDEEGATQCTDDEAGVAGFQGFHEGVGQGAVLVHGAPHQALGDAVHPHGGDVQHGADGGEPEVGVEQTDAVHLVATEDLRNQVVQGADGDHGDPGQGAGVDVTDGPVGVVRQGVNGLD